MAEGSSGRAPAAVRLDDALIDAKLSVPEYRSQSVSRAEPIGRARASGCRVVGVTAPAGYGKTTLLVEWALGEDRRVAWVSLDRFDDDPTVLLTLLAAAYARISPSDPDLVGDMGGMGVSVLGRAAPRLAAALRSSVKPFVIMIDDLHLAQSSPCHDVLEVVLSGVPRGSQLVAASRSEQPHLSRLRAEGDAFELGTSDLAIDAVGAEQILGALHVRLTPELVVEVTERTEGWPVGLHLAALIARDGGGAKPMVAGDDRYVADYLYRESLAHLTEDDRRFLRRTAVLDQLSGSLCDAVVGEPGSQERLRALEAAQQFLVPLDRRRAWYRYHALFREFLLAELHRVEPDIVERLELRAADWYELNGSPVIAVEHLLNTSERARCVQLVTQLVLPTYHAGQISTVQRWLTALGPAEIASYPPLTVLATWIAALTGQTVEALRWAAIVDVSSFDPVPVDGTASFDSARAMLRAVMCAAGPEQARSDAQFAVEHEPEWSRWRVTALVQLAEAHLLLGDVGAAADHFESSAALAATIGNAPSFVLSEAELAVLAFSGGRWAEAAERVKRALAAIDEHRMDDYATSLLAFAAAGRMSVHEGDVVGAERQLMRAMRARPMCTFVMPYVAVRLRLQLADVYRMIGDFTTARHLLKEIDDVLLKRPALGVLVEEVSAFRGILSSGGGKTATGRPPLTSAELRLLPYLQTHLTMAAIGERLFVSRNTVSSEVGSIYRKLGVSSRSDAVREATAIGILGQ